MCVFVFCYLNKKIIKMRKEAELVIGWLYGGQDPLIKIRIKKMVVLVKYWKL